MVVVVFGKKEEAENDMSQIEDGQQSWCIKVRPGGRFAWEWEIKDTGQGNAAEHKRDEKAMDARNA